MSKLIPITIAIGISTIGATAVLYPNFMGLSMPQQAFGATTNHKDTQPTTKIVPGNASKLVNITLPNAANAIVEGVHLPTNIYGR